MFCANNHSDATSNDREMQQRQRRQVESISERIDTINLDKSIPIIADGHDDGDTGGMNFNDTYANSTPHDHYAYEDIEEWPLSPGAGSPSQITSGHFSQGYPHPPYTAEEYSNALTREQQEADTSYTLLARNAASTASADGKIQEPHLNDV